MLSTSDTTCKTCGDCGHRLPIDEFRRRKQGAEARQGRCRACYNAYMRSYRRRRKVKGIHRFSGQLRRETRWNRVVGLCNAMIGRFGGVDGFCGAWADAIQAAQAEKPGGRVVTNSLLAIARLVEACNASHRGPDLSQLTDDQLQDEVLRNTSQLIASHPELAVAAAEQLGWKVIPPRVVSVGTSRR